MQVANYSEFRKNMKACLDKVVENHDALIIHRSGGKSVVVISVDEYNSMDETEYLTSTKANTEALDNAIENVKKSFLQKRELFTLPESDDEL